MEQGRGADSVPDACVNRQQVVSDFTETARQVKPPLFRTDNCVKNHFYSKLRKAVRRLNKIINDSFPTQFKFIRESVLSKIIKTSESKFKNNSKIDEELADFCDCKHHNTQPSKTTSSDLNSLTVRTWKTLISPKK